MYAKSTRPSAKREVQKERSAKRDNRIARPRRAQTCERSELRANRAMGMCPRSGQIFLFVFVFLSRIFYKKACKELMQWGKLQVVQEQDRSKPQSSKNEKKGSCLADS